MAYLPVHALSSAEKLSQQRRAAELARAHAQALQLKVAVVLSCVVAAPLGFAAYHTSAAGKAEQARTQSTIERSEADLRIGAIQLPDRGEQCRQLQFDNRTGQIVGESKAQCAPIEIAPRDNELTSPRAQAIMNAFRFK
jgi:hypothetical protein